MKSNKTSSIILMVMALVFAVIGTVFIFLEESASPIIVSGTPAAVKPGSYQSEVHITFKNNSEEELTVSYIEIAVATSNRTELVEIREPFSLKGGESMKCYYTFNSPFSPQKVSEVRIRVDGKEYDVYGGASTYDMVAVLFYIIAAVTLILSAVCLVNSLKQKKRYENINRELNDRFGGSAIFTVGVYSRQGEAGKAAAKTAASVAVGALFAGLFGFGAYKIYGSNVQKEFVVSDEGLFVGEPLKKGFNLGNMIYFAKGSFPQTEISVKKKRVTMTNLSSDELFIFDTAGNKNITADMLAEKLRALSVPVENNFAENQTDNTVNSDVGDPFDL